MSSDLSTGKTIFILAVVVGCFAVLWPKVFYPMLTASVKQPGSSQVVNWRDQANIRVFAHMCYLIEEQQDPSGFSRLSDEACVDFVRKSCGVIVSEKVAENFRLSMDKTNLSFCLQQKFDITLEKVLLAEPSTARTKHYQSQSLPHPHVRPERPSHLHTETIHPALREKGRTVPHRTIEKQARPGPMPGVRPPMGGGGHMVPPQTKGSGAMGIIMPLYTVGIVIFFVYTIMKVLFKKSEDEDNKVPKLKDFHLDPEYRKYVFAEEYLDSSNASHRDLLKRQERESSKQRRRQDSNSQADAKIEDEQMDQLRRRLEETEKAMERLMSQMGSVTDKLTAAKITEVLSQAQSQARILKDAAEGGSDEDLTTSEAFTNTLSEDFSLPLALQRHLEELKVKDMYLKGTSAGNFGSPPISPDELVSLNGRNNSFQGSAPLIATNTTLLSSFTKENSTVPNENNSQQDGFEILKHTQNEEIEECNLDHKNINQEPVVDFPLHVSSSLKHNLKNDKQKEDLVMSSDIAQYDAAEGHSDREGSSDASETGADISDLKSFADNGAVEAAVPTAVPVVEEKIPEVTYSPHLEDTVDIDLKNVPVKPLNTSSDGTHFNLCHKSSAVEHGTQTEENKKLSVLNLRTTYQIDKKEQKKGMNITEVEDKVNEIVLDATLPIDTQLLVKEAQTGSAVTNNIEIDASEIGSEPCVVTSQVSLAFVGLEHNDNETPYTVVVPEARPKDCVDRIYANKLHHPLQDEAVKLHDYAEEKVDNNYKDPSQEEKLKLEEGVIENDRKQELAIKEEKAPVCFSKNFKTVNHSTECSELKQEDHVDKDEDVKVDDFAEANSNNKKPDLSQKEVKKADENLIENDCKMVLPKEEKDAKVISSKNNNTISLSVADSELKQEHYIDKDKIVKIDYFPESNINNIKQDTSEKEEATKYQNIIENDSKIALPEEEKGSIGFFAKNNDTINQSAENNNTINLSVADSELKQEHFIDKDEVVKIDYFDESNVNNVKQDTSEKEEAKTYQNIIENDSKKALPIEEKDSIGFVVKNNDTINQSTENSELKKEHFTCNKNNDLTFCMSPGKESSEVCFTEESMLTLKNTLESTDVISNFECSNMTKQLTQDMQKDSSCDKSKDIFSLSSQKEESVIEVSGDAENNNFQESLPFKKLIEDPIDRIICVTQQLKEKSEENHKILEDTDCIADKEAFKTFTSEGLASEELLSTENHDNTNKSDNQICAGIIEIPKTVSLESFDLTTELLHGLDEPENEEEFIAIEFTRPESPVPPPIDDLKIFNDGTLYKCNEDIYLNPDIDVSNVQELAETLVEKTTKNALDQISRLLPDEISKFKNEAHNFLKCSDDTSKNICNTSENNNQEYNHPIQSHSNLPQSSNKEEGKKPGKVIGSKESESGGENENIFVATSCSFSKISPPGTPFASDINTSFRLGNINLTDHSTQPVTPTPLFEDPSLQDEEGCITELRSTSPPNSLNADTIREQEAAFRRSNLETHETDMNHRG